MQVVRLLNKRVLKSLEVNFQYAFRDIAGKASNIHAEVKMEDFNVSFQFYVPARTLFGSGKIKELYLLSCQ